MNRRLLAPLLLLFGCLQTCASASETVKRDTTDFFTKLSQGYQLEVRPVLPTDFMWIPVDIKDFEGLNKMKWARDISMLSGYIMQHKGVMNGQLLLLFEIEDGKIKGNARLCQPVENLLEGSDRIRQWSRPTAKVVRTRHRGNPKSLGTAFRVLEDFAKQQGLVQTGWGSVRTSGGIISEPNSSDYLMNVQIYLQ